MSSVAARLDAEQVEDKRNLRKVVAASFIGTTIEWYDFFLYGTAAALVFGDLFFPGSSPLIGTLAAFGTFAVGFAARPLGGIVFGHFGDRIGRKAMLVMSLLIMGVATFLIGCLPTHASIGILAPILLVLLRFAQGIGVGGEWGGAVLMAVEHAPKGKRGFFGAFPQMGVPAGLLLSTVVFIVVQNVTTEDSSWPGAGASRSWSRSCSSRSACSSAWRSWSRRRSRRSRTAARRPTSRSSISSRTTSATC